jgi:hypothetical protein
MLLKPLSTFKVQHGSELVAEDFQQNFRITIHVEHKTDLEDEDKELGFKIIGADKAAETAAAANLKDSRKRILNQSDVTESPAKKMKMVELVDDDELIMGNYTAINN